MSKPRPEDIFRTLGGGLRFSKANKASPAATPKEFLVSETTSAQSVDVKALDSDSDDDMPVVSDDDADANVGEEQKQPSKVRVKIEGENPPEPVPSFSTLSLQEWLLGNIKALGWKKPTLVQSASLPSLVLHRDVIIASPTGSGKTGSYLIPMLHLLKPIAEEMKEQKEQKQQQKATPSKSPAKSPKNQKKGKNEAEAATQQPGGEIKENSCRAIILTPTRELGQQVYTQLKKLCAGQPWKILLLTKVIKHHHHHHHNHNNNNDSTTKSEEEQEQEQEEEPETPTKKGNNNNNNKQKNQHELLVETPGPWDFVISTPQRLNHYISKNLISLSCVRHLVLDEVDRLLGNDFIEQADSIITKCREATAGRVDEARLKIGMFTATFTPAVEELAKSALTNPIRIIIGMRNTAVKNVEQFFRFSGTEEGKLMTIRQMLNSGEVRPPCIVFLQSKERAKDLYLQLSGENVPVDLVTADRTDAQRERAIQSFRTGKIWVIITTDLLARGMDFPAVHTVINYDLPPTPSQYIHRVGRAGRANQHGKTKVVAMAYTLITETDIPFIKPFVNLVVSSGFGRNVPDWLLKMDKIDRKHKRVVQQGRAIHRDAIDPIKAAKQRRERARMDSRKRKAGGNQSANLDKKKPAKKAKIAESSE